MNHEASTSGASDSEERETEGTDADADTTARHDDAATPAACWACQSELQGQYYEVDANRICGSCAERVRNPEVAGTPLGRAARAVAFGGVAGLVGAAVYYGIRALTDYEFGLIAIAVGFMVGVGVKVGSGGRGGWRYQLIAMVITYVSIVSTYVPLIVEGFEQDMALDAASGSVAHSGPEAGAEELDASLPPSTTVASADANAAEVALAAPPSVGVLGWILAFVIALFAPFLFGLENIMGTIILAIGLYEAWKINQRVKVSVEGPFALASAPATPAAAG